jgi:hypothetical protein
MVALISNLPNFLINNIIFLNFQREFKNNLYITYSNGKQAYEAFAQLNNYYLEKYDLHVFIKIEDEQTQAKLIEQELMECLTSVYYARHLSHNVSPNQELDIAE